MKTISYTNATIVEQLGSKRKFWFKEADESYLFKEGRPGTGENWAEVVAAKLCELLGMPHADYELAECDGQPGVITKSFVPSEARLVLGNELLGKIYPGRYDQKKQYKQTTYTILRVLATLKYGRINVPIGWLPVNGVDTALGVFVGYLMFDAWIANQDRHHENWGIILTKMARVHLAPTFDHASSLGRNESDESKVDRLTTKDERRGMLSYVKRAKSPFYIYQQRNKPVLLSTHDAFLEASKYIKTEAIAWLDILSQVTDSQMLDIFGQFTNDEISATSKEFAISMLKNNQQVLLELRDTIK